ncbi:hypothetical protein SCATT_p09750 (plasmid) [Streptantibioticus cattleyicolor NRRL 8057 = DSM 46488]|uniref:Uncharacterized protein n=1 Tax=Streptantibioticus cattleyicolor (strain ATCC 35852 / DSM 46488 / JCM 4925 / NBRC 14057 / NRRL 8057) TaxID=1003195 RepID=G8XDT4_STREN|nr:hypothetical protein SCATT_p09750 [Streptantibioticus cattleyicolor NRRL 8057 = DSM 46488]
MVVAILVLGGRASSVRRSRRRVPGAARGKRAAPVTPGADA